MKQKIINYLFHKLLNAVVLDDVIKSDKRGLFIGGKLVGNLELRQLVAEAKAMEGFRLWKIMSESIKQDALDRGWNKSTKIEDLNTGKTIFYVVDLQESIIRLLKNKDMV